MDYAYRDFAGHGGHKNFKYAAQRDRKPVLATANELASRKLKAHLLEGINAISSSQAGVYAERLAQLNTLRFLNMRILAFVVKLYVKYNRDVKEDDLTLKHLKKEGLSDLLSLIYKNKKLPPEAEWEHHLTLLAIDVARYMMLLLKFMDNFNSIEV